MTGESSRNAGWCRELYLAKAPMLLLYGRALGLSHAESEDVLQDTFQALLGMENQPDAAEYYAVRAFRNRALNYRRNLWRRISREWESRRWFEVQPGETALERAAMKCLRELPREQREVIVLKFWHGHTFEEIGRLQGKSPNTVAGRYRYGIEKIRKQLKGCHEERIEMGRGAAAFLDSADPVPGH